MGSNTKHPRCRSKISKIIRKCWVSNTELWIFAGKISKMCFSPRGSVWSLEGWILLRISLGLAVRHCWSDLEKFPKSAPGEILEGSGQHFGLGTFLSQKMHPEKHDFVEE